MKGRGFWLQSHSNVASEYMQLHYISSVKTFLFHNFTFIQGTLAGI